jgi:hypothetical protein
MLLKMFLPGKLSKSPSPPESSQPESSPPTSSPPDPMPIGPVGSNLQTIHLSLLPHPLSGDDVHPVADPAHRGLPPKPSLLPDPPNCHFALDAVALDQRAKVTQVITPGQPGQIAYRGSWWTAYSDQTFDVDHTVYVVARHNLSLYVSDSPDYCN